MNGIVMLFVGAGWGKSSAAFGYASRSAGRGWRTCVVQFLKGDAWNPGDVASGRALGIEWPQFTPALTWAQEDLVVLGRQAWERGEQAIQSGQYGLVVLDEVTNAVSSGYLEERRLIRTIRERHETTSIIMTGSRASRSLRAVADTITDFRRTKHHGKRGILD